MRREPRSPVFLPKDNYRQRRVMDAARVLPVFATALLLVPMFWTDRQNTGLGMVYLFVVWLAVIVGSAILSRRLSAPLRQDRPNEDAPR